MCSNEKSTLILDTPAVNPVQHMAMKFVSEEKNIIYIYIYILYIKIVPAAI